MTMAKSNGNIPGSPSSHLVHRVAARDILKLIAGDSPAIHRWTETRGVGSEQGRP